MKTTDNKEVTTHSKGVRSRDNNLFLDFTYKHVRFKEYLNLAATVNNVKLAKSTYKDVQDAIRLGKFNREDFFGTATVVRTSFNVFSKRWLEARMLNLGTAKTYASSIKMLTQAFPNLDLADLKPMQLQLWIKNSPLKPKTIRNHIGVLSAIIESAKGEGLLVNNVVDQITLPAMPEYDEAINPFSKTEVSTILYYLEGFEPELGWMMKFAFETGLRPQEYFCLTFKDIDFEKSYVYVHRAIDAQLKGDSTVRFKKPKNNKARYVSLTDAAKDAVRSAMAAKGVKSDSSQFVFTNPRAKGLSNDLWDNNHLNNGTWRVCLRKAGVPYRPLYQARHTFGSQLVSAGVPIAYVSAQMGHRSIEVTQRHYAKFMQESVDEVLKMRNALAIKDNKKKLYLAA